jgi:hypothetical protein
MTGLALLPTISTKGSSTMSTGGWMMMDRVIDADAVTALARTQGVSLDAEDLQQTAGELSFLLNGLSGQQVHRATEPATVFAPADGGTHEDS